MNCEKVKGYLSRYLDDRLSTRLKREVEKHIAKCPTCAEELVAYQQMEQLTQGDFFPEPPARYWEELPQKVLARVPDRAPRKGLVPAVSHFLGTVFSPRRMGWKLAGSLAIAGIAFFIGRTVYFVSVDQPSTLSHQETPEIPGLTDSTTVRTETEQAGSEEAQVPVDARPKSQKESAAASTARMAASLGDEAAEIPETLGHEEQPPGNIRTSDREAAGAVEEPDKESESGLRRPPTPMVAAEPLMVDKSIVGPEAVGEESKQRYKAKPDEAPIRSFRAARAAKVAPSVLSETATRYAAPLENRTGSLGDQVLLGAEELGRARDELQDLQKAYQSQDSTTAADAAVMLARLHYTEAAQDSTKESVEKAIVFWQENGRFLQEVFGQAEYQRVLQALNTLPRR